MEGVIADHRPNVADLESRRIHRDEQDRDAARARLLAAGADEEVAEVGHRGVRRPHLLPVHDVLVGVPDCSRAQRGEIGSGLGLGEALTPDDVTAGDARQVVAALLLGAVAHDRRPDPVDVHVLRATGLADRPQLLTEDGVLPARRRVAAVLDRPVRGQPTTLGERGGEAPAEVDVLRRAEDCGVADPDVAELGVEEGPHLLAKGQVLLGPAELHDYEDTKFGATRVERFCPSEPHHNERFLRTERRNRQPVPG